MGLIQRIGALGGLALARLRGRVFGPEAGRLRLCVAGVALAVALMIVLSGVSLGLAGQSTVESEDIDYWITPADSGTGSAVLPEDGASLGEVHEVTADLTADDRISYASPVLLQPVRIVEPESGESAFVVAIGVIPAEDRSVNGIPVGSLAGSYSYYNDGNYDGEWSGKTVVTDAAIEVLGVDDASSLTAQSTTGSYELTVTERTEKTVFSGLGDVPIVVVPLAELQTIAGVEEADQADQILVSTTDPSVRDDIAGTYPGTDIVTRAGLTGSELTTSSLPLAMAVSSFLVALVVGVLFVATMMGLELTTSRQYLATLDAVGFSPRSRSMLVFFETVILSAVGGLVGIIGGVVGIRGVNYGTQSIIGVTVATFEPVLLAYGFAVGLLIGVLAAPYPVLLARRVDTLEVLAE